MSTFILRSDLPSPPPTSANVLRVAIKDLIDVAGTVTTAGCRAVALTASPATRDAECLAGIRAAETAGAVRIVGKTNLHELAYGVTGINPWYGTPANPLDAGRAPGGSSSGSAVAVAGGEADVALGTDTGGSIRIPAACCGVTGLKTTWGRIPLGGVRPLGPSLDSVGPMARDMAGLIAGMKLLEPGFTPLSTPAGRVGRVRLPATDAINQALDAALAVAGFEVVEVDLPGWGEANEAGMTILAREAWEVNGSLFDSPEGAARVGADVAARLHSVAALTPEREAAAQLTRRRWRDTLARHFEHVEILALPVLAEEAPKLADADRLKVIRYVMAINVAGAPSLALPVPTSGLPTSLQLVGPPGSEELLLTTGELIERQMNGRQLSEPPRGQRPLM